MSGLRAHSGRKIDAVAFIKKVCKPSDFCFLKMDIEGGEYNVMPRLLASGALRELVDEMVIEIHFDHPNMRQFLWTQFAPHTLQEAEAMLGECRQQTICHYWP